MSVPRIPPASSSCTSAGNRPERCQPRPPWKSLRPPGRRNGRTCSRSGAELAPAPSVAGSNGPRRTARSARAARPLQISKRRERMSWCGRRSPARWRIGPNKSAASRDRAVAPAAAPVATWSTTITTRPRSDPHWRFLMRRTKQALRSLEAIGRRSGARAHEAGSSAARIPRGVSAAAARQSQAGMPAP
jgi:hypothetical protein